MLRRLLIAGGLLSFLALTSTASAQLPQDGRAFNFLNVRGSADPGRSFNFLNGHGYSGTADAGRSFNFLHGHGYGATADPGRPAPAAAARATYENTINRSHIGPSLSGVIRGQSTTTPPANGGTGGPVPPFIVNYPGYGYSFFPGFYYNYGLYSPNNPYSFGLIPGIPVGTFTPHPAQP